MIEVYLKMNSKGRFECYNALDDKYEDTLTCGNPFMLIDDETDEEIPGRIEHDNVKGYYWIGIDDTVVYLVNGIKGYI